MFLNRLNNIFLFLIFLFFNRAGHAQIRLSARASLDKNNMVIGEQIHLNLEAEFPLHEPMIFFTIDTLPHFEILDRKKIDTIDYNDGIKLTQSITLTSFDSGHWVIPSFTLNTDKPLLTDTIPVNVGFSPFDPNRDYHPIKDIINVQVKKKKQVDWYWYAAASALMVAAMVYVLLRKKKIPEIKEVWIDPYTEAKQNLERLKKENATPKVYFTGLIDIFRNYVFRRMDISSMQETTDELAVQIRQLKLPADTFTHLAQALRLSDFVKFAKYDATASEKNESFEMIRQAIDLIESRHQATIKKQE